MDDNFPFPQYIEPILKILIDNQQSIYQMLKLADKEHPASVKELSLLINNILSPNIFSIEQFSDEYIIIITRLIIDEVQKLTDKNDVDSFLKEEAVLNCMLSTLYMRQDIIEYFREILHFPLTYIDYIEKDESFIFDIQSLHNILLSKGGEQQDQNEEETQSTRQRKKSFWNFNKNKNTIQDDSLKRTQKRQSSIKLNEIRNPLGKIGVNKEAQSKIHTHISLMFPDIDLNKISTLNERTFITNYIADITINDIDELLNNEEDESMRQYLLSIRKQYETNPGNYSNTPMLTEIYNYQNTVVIFELYRRLFCIVIQLIEEIIIHLEYDFGKLPDILRYICKIIELTLRLKFPDIQEYELIPFLGKFLFEKVMFPILESSIYFGLTDSTILESKTDENIHTLIKIIHKFYSGELFETDEDSSFTLFNKFFITKMDILLHFFHKISTTTQIPHILEKFIYPTQFNFEPSTYIHKIDSNNHEMFCIYSIEQVLKVYDVLNGNIDCIFKDINDILKSRILKCFDKLKEHYNDLQDSVEQSEKAKIRKLRIFNKVHKTELFAKMEQFIEGNIHFNNDDINENDLTFKAKKGFCSCLNDIVPLSPYQTELLLNSEDYENVTLSEALETLSSNVICNYNKFKWDLEQLKPLLDSLPMKYKENNYSLFMKEITSDIHESLKDVKAYFSIIGSFSDDIIYLSNELNRADELFIFLKREIITQTVIHFVNNAKIKIKFNKQLKSKNKNISIKRLKPTEKVFIGIACETIQDFIDEFPDIKQIDEGKNHFQKIADLNVVPVLTSYFQMISEELSNNYDSMKLYTLEHFFANNPKSPYCEFINELDNIVEPKIGNYKLTELNDSYEKCKDTSKESAPTLTNITPIHDIRKITIQKIFEQILNYLMGSLYDKLFPTERSNEDIAFTEQCNALGEQSLIEFEPTAVIDCNDCIVKIVECVYRFEKASSPLEKGYQLDQIIKHIKTKLLHIKKGEITLDDTIPYIWYSIIKAKPLRFVTNLEYISTFRIAKYEYAIASVKTILAQFKNLKKEDKIETADSPV